MNATSCIARGPRWRAFFMATALATIAACSDSEDAAKNAAVQATDASPDAAIPYQPAPAVTQASWAPDALEELLAPIALYPDAVLSQVLAASVNAQEVLDAGNWLLQNPNLKGAELDAASQKAGFGPAMRSLVQFPSVVDMMCQQIEWTRQLGSAFTSDQKAVLDAVQRLRAQAAEVGNLKSTPQQTVTTKTENEKVIVEVKPADPQIVYVPQYNPQVVYTTPPPAEDTVSTGEAVAGAMLAFGVGVLIGEAFDDDCYPHWGYGAVYYGPRPFYPPAYVYRPAYGPAFRPAYQYNDIDIDRNVNINVDNDQYFNRFDNNQNLRGDAKSPIAGGRPGQTPARAGQQPAGPRTAQTAANQPRAAQTRPTESWKGQSTYAGAKNPATQSSLSEAAGVRPANSQSGGAYDAAREAGGYSDRTQHLDRGYGGSTRDAEFDTSARPDARRETDSSPRPSQTYEPASASRSDNAFEGAQRDSASFDRASSARGHASGGGRSRGGGGRRR